jgi:exonuclease VII small subunit
MNFEKFRRTGELSDITVIVNKTEFKLHTFPLFTKSDYFKKAVASSTKSAPYVVELNDHFPGGVDVFNQLADYFYSIPISIDHKNIVPLRSAACFIECDALSALLDERFDKILLVARAKFDLGIPLLLLEQCIGEYQQWAKQAHIVDKCLQAILESLVRGAGTQLSKSDREIITRLPLEWIIELIKLCPPESQLALLPIAKHYITVNVLDQTQPHASPSSTTENGTEHPSAFTPVARKEDLPIKTDEEKRAILDQIVKALGNTLEQLPLAWHNAAYEKAVELKCECESTLSSFITQSILNSSDLDDNLENIPDDVMTRLLERVSKHKEEHIKDPQLLSRVNNFHIKILFFII